MLKQKWKIAFEMTQAIINLESIVVTGKVEIQMKKGKFYLYQHGTIIGKGESIIDCLTNIDWDKVRE